MQIKRHVKRVVLRISIRSGRYDFAETGPKTSLVEVETETDPDPIRYRGNIYNCLMTFLELHIILRQTVGNTTPAPAPVICR